MLTLSSLLNDRWQTGVAPFTALHNAATGDEIAQASSRGLDLRAALDHARHVGGPAIRRLTFAQRGELLQSLSVAIHAQRDALIELSRQNGGTTRGDAKFDIDGATGTLAFYANLGKQLGDKTVLLDGDQVRFSRSSRFMAQHIFSARRGVAIHINAFNFPAWNLCEKLAAALLAGMPVLAKPGTATAMLAVRIAELWHEQNLLPAGVFSLLVGSAGDLLDHVGPQDCVVFTGSGATGQAIRGHAAILRHNVPVNVEADSLNAAVLGPDVSEDADVFDMFVNEIAKEMTQKAGQKCTAIRRIFVPTASYEFVREALIAKLNDQVLGDPAHDRTTIGPVAGPQQHRDVLAGVEQLSKHAARIWGDPASAPAAGAFVAPQLFYTDRGLDAEFVHEHEVFGPIATLLTYDGTADSAIALVAAGGGSLACSLFSDDKDFSATFLVGAAPFTGRIYWGSAKVFDQGSGHGAVMPALVHGGPGKAGGGEELGGERGLRFYMQRTAIQGDTQLLKAILGKFGE